MDVTSTPKPVTAAHPCPVCEGSHACSRKPDGMIFCRRRHEKTAGFVYLGETSCGTWGEFRVEGDPILEARVEERQAVNGNGRHSSPPPSAVDWESAAHKRAEAVTPELRQELADVLGLPLDALDAIAPIGWIGSEQCWTLPERNGAGDVIALNRRYRDGTKRVMPGGKRGLTIPETFRRVDLSPVLLVEGASDVLAATSMGLTAIGRPSNTAGAELLAELLRGVPNERPIIVVAEYDPKADGTWPGLVGARSIAAKLEAALARPASWCLPPDGAKDVRKWLTAKVTDIRDPHERARLGEMFLAQVKLQGAKAEDAKERVGYQFDPVDSADFLVADFRPTWLVKRCLVKGQPAVMAGASKACKTSIAIDLAVALATGTPFLGHFDVYRPARTCVLSGESGEFTLQETARRVMTAKGVEIADLSDRLMWGFRLPQLSRVTDLAALGQGLRARSVEVVILDPLYLALLAGQTDLNASNLYEIGPLLMSITATCLGAGATPVIIHHFKKGVRPGDELSLGDLSFSGIAEYARQWLLIGRREAYEPGSGMHRLTMVVGGSTGQSGSWSIDVDEGQLAEDFTGRQWDVTVTTTGETQKAEADMRSQRARERTEEKERGWESRLLGALDELAAGDPAFIGESKVRDSAGLNAPNMTRTVFRLKQAGIIEEGAATIRVGKDGKTRRTVVGIRRIQDHSDHSDRTTRTEACPDG